MTTHLVLLGAALALNTSARAAEPVTAREELAADSTDVVEIDWSQEKQRPARIHGSFVSGTESPEAAAREFLQRHAALFAIPRGSDLRLGTTRLGLVGTYLRFQEVVGELPAFESEIIVHVVSREGSSIVRDVNLAHVGVDRGPVRGKEIGEARARELAEIAAEVDGELRVATEVVLGILADPNPRLAYRVRMSPAAPLADWEAFVDAETGDVVSLRDRMFRATGTGLAFDPSPVASTGNTALTDNNDATNATLDAARFSVSLPRLDASGFLRGSFVDARPTNVANRAVSAALQFNYTRTDDRFEEVMTYFHLDRVQQRIQSLGFTNVNNRVQTVIVNGSTADNSFYSPGTFQMTTGSGGVDDAEDADILVHEYGHAIQDNQVPAFGGGDEGAMGEGFGDYLAGSMEDVLSPEVTDPNCIADWDAVAYSIDSPPCLRRLDGHKHFPEFAIGEVHEDGTMWSAALFRARSLLGADVMDRVVIESHFSLSTTATFFQAFAALVAADQSLYGGTHVAILRRTFIDQGLSRDLSAPADLPQVLSSDTVSIDNPRSGSIYANFLDNTQTFSHPGAAGLRVHFAQFTTQLNASCFAGACDNVYLTDAAGNLYQVLNGNLGAFSAVVIPGDTVKIRLVTNGSTGAFGYHVDRVDIMGAAGSSAHPVPDGRFVLGTQLRGSRNGATVNATWDASTCPASNYNLYWGSIGNWTLITGGTCGLGTSGAATGLPIPNNSWWVIAGVDGNSISSFGRTGSGAEESFTGWGASGVCPAQTSQALGATCP